MAHLVFWLSVCVIIYVHVGYPLLVLFCGQLLRRRVSKSPYTPHVTILISAHNEAAHIGATLRNKLDLRYPMDRLEIIVVSDGSTDATDAIVQNYASNGDIRLIRQEPRQGKTAALNRMAHEARGEIFVFSDANSLYHPDALLNLVANFADPSVGYVTGRLQYGKTVPTSVNEGCSLYMRYENALRMAETNLGSIVGVNGGIDAVRGRIYTEMHPDDLPDFVLPLRVIEQGYRVVYEPSALSAEDAHSEVHDEYRMRVRVARRALSTLVDYRHLLNPTRYGLFALQLLSHKALRYLAWPFLLVSFVSCAFLASTNSFYAGLFVFQAAFYVTASLGFFLNAWSPTPRFLSVPFYFLMAHIAAAHALAINLRSRTRVTTWQPRRG